GTTYYFKAQAMDFTRNRSAASNEVSAKAGALTPDGFTAVVGNALVTTDDQGIERVVSGNIGGRMWRGQPLPDPTYGFWGPGAYIAVTDLEVYQIDDTTGFSTTDAVNWQDIPNFEISITLDQTAIVLVLMRISAYVLVDPGNSAKGFYRLVYNGSPVRAQAILGG